MPRSSLAIAASPPTIGRDAAHRRRVVPRLRSPHEGSQPRRRWGTPSGRATVARAEIARRCARSVESFSRLRPRPQSPPSSSACAKADITDIVAHPDKRRFVRDRDRRLGRCISPRMPRIPDGTCPDRPHELLIQIAAKDVRSGQASPVGKWPSDSSRAGAHDDPQASRSAPTKSPRETRRSQRPLTVPRSPTIGSHSGCSTDVCAADRHLARNVHLSDAPHSRRADASISASPTVRSRGPPQRMAEIGPAARRRRAPRGRPRHEEGAYARHDRDPRRSRPFAGVFADSRPSREKLALDALPCERDEFPRGRALDPTKSATAERVARALMAE